MVDMSVSYNLELPNPRKIQEFSEFDLYQLILPKTPQHVVSQHLNLGEPQVFVVPRMRATVFLPESFAPWISGGFVIHGAG